MSNPTRHPDEQEAVRELARLWWQFELKCARETLEQKQHEQRVELMRAEQDKVTCRLADFQPVRGAFAIVIGHGVLIVRNTHCSGHYNHGRSVEWFPDQTAACLPDSVVNSEVPAFDAAAAALDQVDQAGGPWLGLTPDGSEI